MNVKARAPTAVCSLRTRRSRILALVVPMILLFAASTTQAGFANAAPPPQTRASTAEAIVKPSVVRISIRWKGVIYFSPEAARAMYGKTGLLYKPGWFASSASSSCSGFVARSDGYIATAGHCVDNQSMQYGGKGRLIDALVNPITYSDYSGRHYLTPEMKRSLRESIVAWGKVEGSESGGPPSRTVSVFQTAAGATTPMKANVLQYKALPEGDVAVLKVQVQPATPMPALEVAPQAPETGSVAIAAGYPGVVDASTDPTPEPSFTEGTVSGTRTVEGVSFTEVSAAMSGGMSGAPVVDTNGRVLGTGSWVPTASGQAFNFIIHRRS